MKEDTIKLSHVFFDYVISGEETEEPFELLIYDSNYQVGDILVMSEDLSDKLTGRVARGTVTYKLDNYLGLDKGFCILGVVLESGV